MATGRRKVRDGNQDPIDPSLESRACAVCSGSEGTADLKGTAATALSRCAAAAALTSRVSPAWPRRLRRGGRVNLALGWAGVPAPFPAKFQKKVGRVEKKVGRWLLAKGATRAQSCSFRLDAPAPTEEARQRDRSLTGLRAWIRCTSHTLRLDWSQGALKRRMLANTSTRGITDQRSQHLGDAGIESLSALGIFTFRAPLRRGRARFFFLEFRTLHRYCRRR